MSIGLKRHAKMVGVVVALLVMMTLVVLPGVAEAQGTDGATVAAAQDFAQDAYATAPQPTPESATRMVVGPGDSLWSISRERLGPEADPAQIANEAERTYRLNRDRIGEDPNLILPGQELLLPPAAEPLTSISPGEASEPVTSVPLGEASEPVTSVPPEEASEPATNDPTADGVPTAIPAFGQGERRLLGVGIFALTLLVVILMAWKLPIKRSVEDPEVWGISRGYYKYRTPGTEAVEEKKPAPGSGAPDPRRGPSSSPTGTEDAESASTRETAYPSIAAQQRQERLRRIRQRTIRQRQRPLSW